MLRRRFIVIQAFLMKQEKSQINTLNIHVKQVEKEKKKKLMVSKRKEIIKMRVEINAKEKKRDHAKINRAKSWFFEQINKRDKPLVRLIKKKKEESNQQN